MPDWTKNQLEQELEDYGHHYLESGRPESMVQRAVEELLAKADWPWQYREASADSGTTIADLGRVKQVLDSQGNAVLPMPKDWIIDSYGGVTPAVGQPQYYYRSGLTQLVTYPSSTGLTICHFSRYGWRTSGGTWEQAASAGSSVPGCPPEYRDIIINLARCYAKDDVDDADQVEALRGIAEARIQEMRQDLLHEQVDEVRRVKVVSGEDWA